MKLPLIALASFAALTAGAAITLRPGGEEPAILESAADKLPGPGTFREIGRDEAVQLAQATVDTPDAKPKNVTVDESALRYFASKGDTARLNAEIARLRALYPQWVPPEDPLAVPQNADPQLEEMWKLYAEARYADVRKAIADRQVSDPDWTPPADLIDRLELAENRVNLLQASGDGRHAEVIEIAAQASSLLTCDDVDVLWRVAESFARTDRVTRSRDAYSYILKNCSRSAERIATVQKAAAILGYKDMQDLLALEKPLEDGTMEFEPIRDDLARRFVAEGNEDKDLTIDPSYLLRLERLVETGELASDALLLGWYHLRRDDLADAERWFRKARSLEETASASQGLALTLIARDLPKEAEEVLYRWRDSSKEASSTYLAATANLLAEDPPPELPGEVLERISAAVMKEKDPATAQQFGWYALSYRQPGTAEQWFSTALRWKPDDEPSAYGLAVARLQQEDAEGLAELKAAWKSRSERIETLGEEQTATESEQDEPETRKAAAAKTTRVTATKTQTRRSSNVEPAPKTQQSARSSRSNCHTTADPESHQPAAALERGWCLMNMNRPLEAVAFFEVAMRSGNDGIRRDAAYGQSLGYLRAGLVGKAAVSAAKAPQDAKRSAELQSAILADRAVAAFDGGRYRETILYLDQLAQLRTERVDLMVLRAYAYKNLNRRADARRLFEAAAATGHRDAIRALGDMNAEDQRRL